MATESELNDPAGGNPASGNGNGRTAKAQAKSAKDNLVHDFESLVADAEKLRQSAAGLAGEEMAELRDQLNVYLRRARESLHLTEGSLREQGIAARERTEEYLHEHPWGSIGLAAGVGFLVGMLVRR